MTRLTAISIGVCGVCACDDGAGPKQDLEAADSAVQDSSVSVAIDASMVRDSSSLEPAARDSTTADAARTKDADGGGPDAQVAEAACVVGPVPEKVRTQLELDPFYKKYADANGLAVLSSNEPDDRALKSACELVIAMLGKRDDVRQALISAKARFAIIGKDEGTAEIPEYGYRERSQEERDQINQRARGLGGQVASCGEENISCLSGDRYRDESICVHEFSHTISSYGVYRADRTFQQRLRDSYRDAQESGILERTYRGVSEQEYWAEGVQDWFNTNASANPPNGIHNQVDTRPELMSYDPTLYALIDEVFPAQLDWTDCHAP